MSVAHYNLTKVHVIPMEERRRSKRFAVSIPCTVYWHGHVIRGQIANLSLGGALIIRLSAIPAEDASVILTFQAEKGEIELKGKLTSRVIHSVTESIEQGEIGSIGVEFQESLEEVRSQLDPVFRTLESRPE